MTTRTVVLQSHAPDAGLIVARCTESVRAWAKSVGHDYRLIHDALFDLVSPEVAAAAHGRMQMAADVARLVWIRTVLDEGADRVIWIDADVLIFAPDRFDLSAPDGCLFGREVWVQPDADGHLKAYRNVHNALLLFTPMGRVTLDFYLETAERMLLAAGPNVPPQFVGPKLLTALNNVVGLPVSDCIGMASPLVVRDLAAGGGPALDLLVAKTEGELAGLNLCSSLIGTTSDGVDLTDTLVLSAIDALLDQA